MLNKKEQQIADLEDQLFELTENNKRLMTEVESYKQTISGFVGVKQAYENDVAELNKKHETEINELKAIVQATKDSINRKVNESLMTIGVNMFVPEEIISSPTNTPQSIYETFVSLQGAAQTDYYRKHEKVISDYLAGKQQ